VPRPTSPFAALAIVLFAAGCGSSPPPEAPPLGPFADPNATRSDPLVIATDTEPALPPRPDRPVVEVPQGDPGRCALSLARAPRPDCRAILPLSIGVTGGVDSANKGSDGDTCTVWNAGASAPQSITLDLGTETRVDAIVLVPEMTPGGSVRHAVSFSNDGKTFQVGQRIEAPMQSGVAADLVLPKPERARFVRVTTEASPSWVAWREVGLFRCGS
jgi:hypothetical protein